MNELVFADLRIDVLEGDVATPTRLHWSGRSTEEDPSKVLIPFFQRVLEAASAAGTSVEMHFERLEYCNSLTIMSLIQLVRDARRLNVKLVLVHDGGLRWQKLMFEALKTLAKDEDFLELRAC